MQKAMEDDIQEALAFSFIQPSTSPARAGFVFVGKKDRGFNPFTDYQGPNKIINGQGPLSMCYGYYGYDFSLLLFFLLLFLYCMCYNV